MDSIGFNNWIKWWYIDIKECSNGPWILLFDNCGGHEPIVSMPRLRIEILPTSKTARYQPLDQSMISQAKIRYRSLYYAESATMLKRDVPAIIRSKKKVEEAGED